MDFSPHSRSKTRNSFIALLLPAKLHNSGALASVNHLDGTTYRPDRQKTRKSNAALLLPLFVPVSPLLRYSYEKMGGVGGRAVCLPKTSIGMSRLLCVCALCIPTQLVRTDGLYRDPLAGDPRPVKSGDGANYLRFLSLTENARNATKKPQCFLSLRDRAPRKYLCFLSLKKKGGEGCVFFISPLFMPGGGVTPGLSIIPIPFNASPGVC
jgi:hypothetical protein